MKYDFELDLHTRNSLSCIINQMKPNTKVLEFGCANGRMTKYLKENMHCSVDIIELDEEAGKQAAKYAEKALLGAENGNAETLCWHSLLRDIKYDYIIFADILEHLHNPKDVLSAAKSHLNTDGSILVSIPNIANNNIIANLLDNEFVYTDVGLLDRTHITFFTKKSFEKLVKECDYHISYESATYINMGNCEVPILYDQIPDKIKKILMNHEYGDVYQFIFELKVDQIDCTIDLEKKPEKYFVSTLYYRFIDGQINESDTVKFTSNLGKNKFHTKLQFEHKIDLLRLDLIENSCILSITDIIINGSEISKNQYTDNTLLKKDSLHIFDTDDPSIYIEIVPQQSIEIEINYEILDFSLDEAWTKLIKNKLQETNNQIQKLKEEKEKEIKEKEREAKEKEEMLVQSRKKENELREEIEKYKLESIFHQDMYERMKSKYLSNEERLDRLHHRLKFLWNIFDFGSRPLQNGNIDYYIDSVTISIRKVHIRGWCVTNTGESYKIKGRPTLNVKQYPRSDVNKVKGMNDSYLSGFDIFAFPLLPLKIRFQNRKNSNLYKVNLTNLYGKYCFKVFCKLRKSLKNRGLKNTLKVCWSKLWGKGHPITDSYENWFFMHRATKDELYEQKHHNFAYKPMISIIVPTYNTPETLLNEMVQSIKNQTYANWELCIADGNSEKKETLSLLKKLQQNEDRIKVKYLNENYMISGNTNEAMKMASGEFVCLMDHDDLLEPNALYEFVRLLNEDPDLDFIYTDEDKINEDGTHYMIPHFKPDFSLDTLRNYNYITHFVCIRKVVLDEIGPFDSKCDGAQDFDLFLRLADYTDKIGHISKILYHWRVCENSTAQSISTKSYVVEAGKYALRKHLERNSLKGTVTDGQQPTLYKINYDIEDNPLISIIICTKDHIDDLDLCIQSILKKSTYQNFEIIVVENNSEETRTFQYYNKLKENPKINIVYWEYDFNYSAINNYGVKYANGDYVLLLNNDTEVITSNWLEEMLMFAQREDVGVVGAKLLYPDDTVQHAGVIVGLGGVAAHSHRGYPADSVGYVGRMIVVQNISAVTGACMMIKKSKYLEVGGLSEKYQVTYNDVDFCLRVMKAGYKNIMNPYAQMYHYESKSRGMEDTSEKYKRFMSEQDMFKSDWQEILEKGDPYYNKNLTLDREDFSLRE